jgi:GxxExxY protein
MSQIHTNQQNSNLLFRDETYQVIGICMEVHRNLGHGFLEIVYKDAIEFELKKRELLYDREREFKIEYKGVFLPHKFYADFTVGTEIILEIKAAEGGLSDDQVAQTINYLKSSGCRIGLLVNFGRISLEYRRLIN